MGIMRRALELLLPRGYLWRLIGDASKLVEALGISLDRAKDLIDQTRREAIPKTAFYTLPEWHASLGIKYDPTVATEKQRVMLDAMHTANGNCSLGGLAVQIAKEYAGLSISEDTVSGYSISGTVETETDAMRVGAILSRFAPLHLIPTVFGFTAATGGNDNPVPPTPGAGGGSIINMTDLALCGVATCGTTTCGVTA